MNNFHKSIQRKFHKIVNVIGYSPLQHFTPLSVTINSRQYGTFHMSSSPTTEHITGVNTCGTLDVWLLQDQLAEFLHCAQSVGWVFIQLVLGLFR